MNRSGILLDSPNQLTYGRVELKRCRIKNMVMALIIAVILHLSAIGAYYAVNRLGSVDGTVRMVRVRILKYSDLGPPPSISAVPPPPGIGVAAGGKPSVGAPVPVPDVLVSPEQTIATQTEMSSAPSPAMEAIGEGGSNVQISQDITIEEELPGIDEFIPIEKEPQVVVRAVPEYPEMARRAGMEGKVWVKMLVDKDGTVLKAVVVKSTAAILDNAAIEAAKRFKFTPAYMNNGPVRVWVAIPFRFQLNYKVPS
jgi:protein TonB